MLYYTLPKPEGLSGRPYAMRFGYSDPLGTEVQRMNHRREARLLQGSATTQGEARQASFGDHALGLQVHECANECLVWGLQYMTRSCFGLLVLRGYAPKRLATVGSGRGFSDLSGRPLRQKRCTGVASFGSLELEGSSRTDI